MRLLETYNISITKIQKKDGTTSNYAYIDPKKSTDDTRNIKDGIKQFGANWNKFNGVWGWYLSPDPQKMQNQLDSMIYPAIEWLNSQETPPETGARNPEQLKAEFQELLKQIDQAIAAPILPPSERTAPLMDEKTLKSRLQQYKEELVNAMTNEEFLAKLEPIIKFRNAQGHQLSFLNALLIYVQNPQAKLVKARTTWANIYNREVKPDARALAVWVPVVINNDQKKDYAKIKAEIDRQTKEFLAKVKKTDTTQLTAGEKDRLRVILNAVRQQGGGGMRVFRFKYCYYDVADTIQMEGKEDVVGSMSGIDDIEWNAENSEATEMSVKICDAMTQIIQEAGIRLGFTDDLGGAMGVSKSGEIEILRSHYEKKNPGAASTLIHEFSHELLHQKYISSMKNTNSDWAQYFVGTKEGRGVVEQQAELSAYLVLRFFNIKLQENINYIAIWGADASKACVVFDTVASVANAITDKISAKLGMSTLNEDGEQQGFVTGLDVAQLLGPEAVDVYNQSKRMMRQTVTENFKSFFNRINKQLF